MKRLALFAIAIAIGHSLMAQSSYIVEQLGRNEHQIIQSLGAFVGLERAESQMFDITFTPSGNNVEGRMIINTADYRCTFRMTTGKESTCFKIELICRTADFLRDFQQLFQVYPTSGTETTRHMNFGDKKLLIEEQPSNRALPRTYIITQE